MKKRHETTLSEITLGPSGHAHQIPHTRLEPKLLTILRLGYTRKQFFRDVVAGLIVGIVSLPLAIAFAIASGVKPEQGLYTAIVAGFTIAVLGGSRAQISGPTGAFIVIIYGIVQQHGYDGLAVATLIAGVLLIIMGFARIGALLKFVPYPVTVGFTSGIALIIFSSQIRDLLGLKMESVPAEFVEKWVEFSRHSASVNAYAAMVAGLSLALILLWPKVTHRIPGSLVAIVVATIVVRVFDLPVDTIASRFGQVPNTFPVPHFPSVSWELIRQMFSPGVTIAMLAALESLLSAVVADGMLGTRHRSNMELVAQGVGNVVSPLFLGIPATGAIARTATNIKSGGRTPVAAVVHSATLLFILLFAGQWAALIPMPALAAILVMVAYNMSEWHAFVRLLKSPKSDVAVLLTTFALTVLIDLTVAIQVGVVLAAFLFLQRMSTITQVSQITDEMAESDLDIDGDAQSVERRTIPPGVEVFEIFGSLFFGAVERFNDAMRRVERSPKVLILRMRDVLSIDATGLQTLDDLASRLAKRRIALVVSGVRAHVLETMERAGSLERLGRENVVMDIDSAIERAQQILDSRSDPERTRF